VNKFFHAGEHDGEREQTISSATSEKKRPLLGVQGATGATVPIVPPDAPAASQPATVTAKAPGAILVPSRTEKTGSNPGEWVRTGQIRSRNFSDLRAGDRGRTDDLVLGKTAGWPPVPFPAHVSPDSFRFLRRLRGSGGLGRERGTDTLRTPHAESPSPPTREESETGLLRSALAMDCAPVGTPRIVGQSLLDHPP
jgi:hypothetical protein